MKNWSQAWFHVLNWESSHWLRSDFRCAIATFIIINDNHINHHHCHHQYQSQSSSSSMTIISIIIIVIMNTVRSIEQVTGVRISSVCVWVNIVVNNLVFFLLSFLGIFSYFYLFILILLWTAWWQWQCAIASVGHLVFLFLICYIWHFCLKFHYKVGILTSAISKSCPLTRLQWPSFDPLHYFTKKIK